VAARLTELRKDADAFLRLAGHFRPGKKGAGGTYTSPDSGLKNCANSLYICGVNRVFCVNKINNLAPQKSGCESCRPQLCS
jgi:hypothetical protein